ncbi:MAG: hypothetical protein ACREDR_02445, partial [Blastocatellia bacterium]
MKNRRVMLFGGLAVLVAAAIVASFVYSRSGASPSSGQAASQTGSNPVLISNISSDPGWPRKIESGDTTILFYDPQIQKWSGDELEGFAAVGVQTGSAELQGGTGQQGGHSSQTYGQVYFKARAVVNKENRTVTMDRFQVTKGSFPTASDKTSTYLAIIQQAEGNKVETVPLDQIQSDLAIADAEHKDAEQLRNDPPRIVYSSTPAVLVLIDGQPVLRPAGEGGLQRVINTRALILFDQNRNTYYLSLMNGWAQAPSPEGPWTFARDVPASAGRLKATLTASGQVDPLNGEQSKQNDSAETGDQEGTQTSQQRATPTESLRQRAIDGTFPTIYVSSVPAELIATTGVAQFKPVPNTGLLYVTNSGNQIFLNTANQDFYILVSGRWFAAKTLNGPWSYMDGKDLPGDFAKIPEGDPKASALASIPGTPAAQEAEIENQIPQTATINRAQARMDVRYDGAPQFQAISGTNLQYAINSATPVIEVQPTEYLAVQEGVWFEAGSPLGPWVVATSVPPDVYSIPPSSPIHNVTYVRVYGYTPDVVYAGYTPGYYGTVVEPDGCVVYGTGFYYPPYIGSAWFGWPWTYGFGVGFGWSPWSGWGLGFGAGFVSPFYGPWWGPFGWAPVGWGPFGFGWGFPRWGPGFGFAWGPGFGWGGLRPFNVYGRWGAAALIAGRVGWAGGRFGDHGWHGEGWRGSIAGGRTGFGGANGAARGFAGNPRSPARGAMGGRFGTTGRGIAGAGSRVGRAGGMTGRSMVRGSQVARAGSSGTRAGRFGGRTGALGSRAGVARMSRVSRGGGFRGGAGGGSFGGRGTGVRAGATGMPRGGGFRGGGGGGSFGGRGTAMRAGGSGLPR